MKFLVDHRIQTLFGRIGLCILLFVVAFFVLTEYAVTNAPLLLFVCGLLMALSILWLCLRYFRKQNDVLEAAVTQIRAYVAGDHTARIPSDEEGELYRLFHEINSLASILSAHTKNETQAKEFLKRTIGDISHQLKTPLAALNVYNGILQENPENAATVREFIALSEGELDRIDTLVQNLLKITKLDAGAIILPMRAENVPDLLRDVQKRFLYRAEQEGKTICLAGSGDATLLCDRDWLTEAVGNIVKNALDHTEKGNVIHVSWMRCATFVQITIADNGSGIHPEDLPHIFKRFYRSQFAKDTPGIGLGLPLAKAIIQAHNGTIEVASTLGVGATFVVRFVIPTKLYAHFHFAVGLFRYSIPEFPSRKRGRTMHLLEVESLCKTYGSGESAVQALKNVSFSVPKGEFVAVVGASGSGKSTLLNLLGGLDTPTSGKIWIDGNDIFQMKERQLTIFRRRNIGFIFQAFNLIPELTVEQNIVFPLLLDYQKPDQAYLEELLGALNLRPRRGHLPSQLSGGQQQRVAIGRALITRPALLLADEPTGNLDSQNSAEVLALLKAASKQYEQTILMITHNQSMAQTADRVLQVSDGVLTDFGRCRE